MATQLAKHIGD